MDRGAWRAAVEGAAKNQHNLVVKQQLQYKAINTHTTSLPSTTDEWISLDRPKCCSSQSTGPQPLSLEITFNVFM